MAEPGPEPSPTPPNGSGRRAAALRARDDVLERIVRRVELDEVLGRLADYVDPDAPERVELVVLPEGREPRLVGRLEPVETAVGAPPRALAELLERGTPVRGAEADPRSGWTPARRAWLEARPGARWSAVPVLDGDGRAVGAAVRFDEGAAEPRPSPDAGDVDEAAQERLRVAAALAGIALGQADLIERLRHRAFHDALTGLPTRALMHERLSHEMERARRDGHALGVLMLAFDGLEELAELHGRTSREHALHEAARRLAWVVRSDETVARIGDDRFVVVVRGTEAAARVAERIEDAFEDPFEIAGRRHAVRPAIGIAHWPADGEDAASILAAAGSALSASRPETPANRRRPHDEPPEGAP